MAQRYVSRNPRREKGDLAARYQFGQPLDDLLEVARSYSGDARMVEVPEWRCLLVRERIRDDGDEDYEVVADGHWLIYSLDKYVLITLDDETFNHELIPVEGEG